MKKGLATIQDSWDRMKVKPVRTSRDRAWGLTVDSLQRKEPMFFYSEALDHHLLIYCREGAGAMRQARSSGKSSDWLSPGSCSILPSGEECLWDGIAPAHVQLRIPTQLLQRAGTEVRGIRPAPELLSIPHTRDPFIGRFAELFDDELKLADHPAQALMVDAALCALCLHLARRHCTDAAAMASPGGGLPPWRLSLVVQYMHENLDDVVRLAELATLAGVSRFHFARMFKQSTGVTPMDYLERIRIEKAKDLLTRSRGSVSTIASFCGFADASYFARRFRSATSLSPSEFAKVRGTHKPSSNL